MNSYIPYMGSKNSVAEKLVKMMPSEANQTYIDLFFGGGSVFFAKQPSHTEIINDVDLDLMTMHEMVARHPDKVMRELNRLVVARRLYEETRSLRQSGDWQGLSQIEQAARMIYLFSCAFNANPRSPFAASSTVPLKFKPDKDLRPYADRLKGVTLECLEWSELLDRYVLQPKKITGFIFADPPYIAAIQKDHYRHRFTHLDHVLLARKLTAIHQCNGGDRNVKIMVTLDDDPLIRALYRENLGWRIQPLPIRYNAGHHSTKTDELLITNYDIRDHAASNYNYPVETMVHKCSLVGVA